MYIVLYFDIHDIWYLCFQAPFDAVMTFMTNEGLISHAARVSVKRAGQQCNFSVHVLDDCSSHVLPIVKFALCFLRVN